MKRFAGLLCAFVTIALVGSSAGDRATECTTQIPEGQPAGVVVDGRVHRCLEAIRINSLGDTTEEVHATLREHCGRLPAYDRCLEDTLLELGPCLNDTQRTSLGLYNHHKTLLIEVICGPNGDNAVELYDTTNELEDNFVESCKRKATREVNEVGDGNADPNGYVMREYETFRKTRECLEKYRGYGHDSIVDRAVAVCTTIMDRSKCFKDGADVLCKTILESH